MLNTDKITPHKLYRSLSDRMIAGVAGGLGEYFNIDANLIRIIFILLAVFGGSGFLIYLLLWIMIPTNQTANKTEDHIKINAQEISDKAKEFAHEIKNVHPEDNKFWWGIVIVGSSKIIHLLILLFFFCLSFVVVWIFITNPLWQNWLSLFSR